MPRKLPQRKKLIRRRDPFDEVEPLTQEILQHQRAANIKSVASRAEQGRILVDVRQTIPHGSWLDYVTQKLPFERSTADRAIDLYHFRENHPAVYAELEPVLLSVAHFLIARPVSEVAAFLATTHVIPGTGATKSPSAMTLPEVLAVFRQEPAARGPHQALLRRYRKAGRNAVDEIHSLIANRHALDPDDVTDVYDDLLHALAELAHHFDLEA
ncbi:MAG: DUF3102 domain-containing protein [Polyangiaceae bacterium]